MFYCKNTADLFFLIYNISWLIFENLKVQNKKAFFNPNLLPFFKKFYTIKYKYNLL